MRLKSRKLSFYITMWSRKGKIHLSPVHTVPEKIENANQWSFGFVFEENFFRKITGLIWRYRFWKTPFSKCFFSILALLWPILVLTVGLTVKPRFQISPAKCARSPCYCIHTDGKKINKNTHLGCFHQWFWSKGKYLPLRKTANQTL